MKEAEKNKLRMLDPEGLSGTIQSTLLDPNINQASYPEVLYYLLSKTLEERQYYEKMHLKFMNVLKANNLLTNELLELKE